MFSKPGLAATLLLALHAAAAGAEISATKRALIVELLQISGAGRHTDEVARLFLTEIHGHYPEMVEQVLSTEPDLSEAERERLREHLDFETFSELFLTRFPQRIDLQGLFEEVYVPLYDEHFDEAELRQLVAFYRSPAGRKALTVMPTLMQQGLERTVPLVQPRVMSLVGEVLAEQRSRSGPGG
jgi:uncharacterized protein